MTCALAKPPRNVIRFFIWTLLILVISGCGKNKISVTDLSEVTDETWREAINAPSEYLQALEQSSLIYLKRKGGYPIPVRVFGQKGERYPVVFTHGLQSHSAWFAQSAAFLAQLGHPVYVFDRSGSGLSAAPRGDAKDFKLWADEIRVVAEYACRIHGYDRHLLVGHCFGAIPATVYAYLYPDKLQGVVLTTPAIYTKTSIPFSDMLHIFFSKSGQRDFLIPVMLQPELFTELKEYELFIQSDILALKAATGDFYYQVNEARRFITGQIDLLEVPLFMALASEDLIGNNRKNEEYFHKIPHKNKFLVIYQDARHILEFSPEKARFFSDLSGWLSELDRRVPLR